jgi:hypothetical protein
LELEFLAQELELRRPFEAEKFQQEIYKEQVSNQVQMGKENFKEDRKDQRTEKQATQQSKMKEQAANNSGAIDFENKGLF